MFAAALLQKLAENSELYGDDLSLLIERNRGSFALAGEDVIILSTLLGLEQANRYSFGSKGIYVDLGAWHPYFFSNTFLFYLIGYKGVNVDANIEAIKLFEKFRPDDSNVVACLSDKAEEVTYSRFKGSSANSITANHEGLARGEVQSPYEYLGQEKMQTVPVNSILEQYVRGRNIDILSIDLEGMDTRIIQAIDFQKYRPLVVAAEIQIAEWSTPDFQKFLNAIGYRAVGHAGSTGIFLRDS